MVWNERRIGSHSKIVVIRNRSRFLGTQCSQLGTSLLLTLYPRTLELITLLPPDQLRLICGFPS